PGSEPDPLGALGGRRDEELRRRDDLEAGRMVLADPRLLVPEPVEVLDQREIAMQRLGRILVERVKGCEKDAVPQRERVHAAPSIRTDSASAAAPGRCSS